MVEFLPSGWDLARTAGFWPTPSHSGRIPVQIAKFRPPSPEFGRPRFWQNYLDFGLYLSIRPLSLNPATVAGILSVSDEILSPVIYILFYINISMLWIKIDFYKLIWLNENIKNICDFSYAPNTGKCFQRKIFSWKMTSQKPFYIETNGAKSIMFSLLGSDFYIFLGIPSWVPLLPVLNRTCWAKSSLQV